MCFIVQPVGFKGNDFTTQQRDEDNKIPENRTSARMLLNKVCEHTWDTLPSTKANPKRDLHTSFSMSHSSRGWFLLLFNHDSFQFSGLFCVVVDRVCFLLGVSLGGIECTHSFVCGFLIAGPWKASHCDRFALPMGCCGYLPPVWSGGSSHTAGRVWSARSIDATALPVAAFRALSPVALGSLCSFRAVSKTGEAAQSVPAPHLSFGSSCPDWPWTAAPYQ